MKKILNTQKKSITKKIFGFLIILLISLQCYSQSNVGINASGLPPNASAGLDVDFPNKGILIPRVSLTSTTSFAPLLAHVAGMIVYNTATIADVVPGFYYDNGTKWIQGFLTGSAIGDMLYWNGTQWTMIPIGLPGQYLQISSSNIPNWGAATITGGATLTTTVATAITGTTATSGGNITSDGGTAIIQRGVCWDTLTAPTIAKPKTIDGSGIGVFTSNLTNLLPGRLYYARAYAMNSNVISYGNQITFTTLPVIPTLAATTAATLITGTTASTGGNVTSTGGATIIERGVCYSTTVTAPTILNTKVIDAAPGPGIFVSLMTGLLPNTLYYVRSYATNSVGTGYGALTTFITRPTITTTVASSITGGSAVTGGVLTGGTSSWYYGIAYSTIPNAPSPTLVQTGTFPATSPLTFTTTLTGLASNTTYYIRAYVIGSGYTVYGPELNFTTLNPTAPIVASTNSITNKLSTSATSGGTITNDGGSTIIAKGVVWSTTSPPVLGVNNFTNDIATYPGITSFTSNMTGLSGNTVYFVRAYATNGIGTSYGPVTLSFKTWVQSQFTVGQNVGYGIVGFVDSLGGGFIVSPDIYPTSPATSFTWGCNGTHVAVGTAFGTGKTNTDLIIANCGSATAAGIAKSFTGGGFNDWFLPSNGEWAAISGVYFYFGLGTNVSYFTSSEYGTNYNYASSYFSTSAQAYASGSPRIGDAYTTAIRAIRTFIVALKPTLTTDAVFNINATTASSGGNITNDGGSPVTARGVCWSTSPAPTIALPTITNDGTGTGVFSSNMTGLTTGLTYYVRAYATNAIGTSYGNEVSFVPASSNLATLTTDPLTVNGLVGSIAEGNYTVLTEGSTPVTSVGLCWGTAVNPTITLNSGIVTDPFYSTGLLGLSLPLDMTGLTVGTLYHVRAFAINGSGTAYGADVTFTATAATLGEFTQLNYQSGVVFNITSGGAHGLIALSYSPGQPADWGCTNSVTGATGTAVGTGNANTIAINTNITANGCISGAPALQFAAQMSNAGPEWYLPSKDELNLLWTTVNADQTLYSGLTFGLVLSPYWSSSEVNATNAWYFDGITWLTGTKTSQYNVWAIRSF